MIEFLIAVLATQQVVETWSKGSLFATSRAKVETWRDEGVEGFFRNLLTCKFCLGHWVAAVVVFLFVTLLPYLPEPAGGLLSWPIQALAVVRAAQLLHDLTAGYNRTPDPDPAIETLTSRQEESLSTQALPTESA